MPKPALFTTAPISAPIDALTIAQALRPQVAAKVKSDDRHIAHAILDYFNGL